MDRERKNKVSEKRFILHYVKGVRKIVQFVCLVCSAGLVTTKSLILELFSKTESGYFWYFTRLSFM